MRTISIARTSLAVAFILLLVAGAASADVCDLLEFKEAAPYGAVVLGKASVKASLFEDDASIAMTFAGGRLLDQGGGNVSETGVIDYVPGIELDMDDWVVGGGMHEKDLSAVVADVLNVHLEASSLTPTQSLGPISSSTTITGEGGMNVIQITGDVRLDAGKTLTISGGPTDFFVIQVAGKFEMKQTEMVLNGVDPQQIMFVFTEPGQDVTIEQSKSYGTFLNPTGKISVKNAIEAKGAFIASRMVIQFVTVVAAAFQCPECPDPELKGANLGTPAAPRVRHTAISPFYLPSYDSTTLAGRIEAFHVALDGTIEDALGNPVVDPVTHLPVATRTPYWEAGEVLKTDTSRALYTTKAGSRVVFDTTNVSEVDLGLVEPPIALEPDYPFSLYPNYPGSGVDTYPELHAAVVAHVHGKDAFDEDDDANTTEMRDYVLGDFVHSNVMFIGSPAGGRLASEDGYDGFVTSYGQRDRVVYVGANDGMIHGFDAGPYWNGVDPAAYDPGTGAERFGYIPGLLLDRVKLRVVDVRQFNPMVDGAVVAADAWLGDDSGNKTADEWATVLIAGFRDGGRGYLALDVTDPDATAAPHGPYPKLLWEFTHPNLGLSWSEPAVTRVKVRGPVGTGDDCGNDDGDGDCRERWVAIFGGGYMPQGDPNEPTWVSDPASPLWTAAGKAIFMVALDTGEVLASVEFDATGTNGPAEMVYALPSAPAVLDVDFDGFADVVYIGDLGGQVWKWDVHAVGIDTDADPQLDNWSAGVFFRSDPEPLAGGGSHYRSFFFPPSAAYLYRVLTLAFGSGERNQLNYQGDAAEEENNRFYVVQDRHPTGPSAFGPILTEANLTNVTALDVYANPGNSGYYFQAEDGEKFVTDVIIFAGYVIAAAYRPDPPSTCGPGSAFLYAFRLNNGKGYLGVATDSPSEQRRELIGSGIPTNPRVGLAPNPDDDVIHIHTSEGELLTLDAPPREEDSSMVYWRQKR